ncbi:uncharacterized protein LOC108218988 isoform X2 [Daucus carota subsp. sativus]|uniref:uncharacterized protein LOC108218988 isoform X2 n=1 Tax=Daucus carota subsp. sativus TaxID=79200 RepID=UPI003082721F
MDSKLDPDPTHDQLLAPVDTDDKASLDSENHNKRAIAKFPGSHPLSAESANGIEALNVQLLQEIQSMDSEVKDSKLDESKIVFPKNDKELSVPLTTKQTALGDLQNDNERLVLKSVGNSALLTESGSSAEAAKLSGTKRAQPESSRHPSPGGTAANGHFVYVRRKAETEAGKCSNDDSTSISADHSQSKENSHQNENIEEHLQEKESNIVVPEASNIERLSVECVSKAPAGSPPVSKSSNTFPSTVSNHLPVRSSQPSLGHRKRTKVQHWEERYYKLQNLLKQLDNSSHEGYVQMLRSFSSVELSRHAVELEKRAIQLSLTEAFSSLQVENGKELCFWMFLAIIQRVL